LISTKRLSIREYVEKPISRVEFKVLEDALAEECNLLPVFSPNIILKRSTGTAVEYVLVYTGTLLIVRLDKSSNKLSYEVYYGREKIIEGTCS
jgi:hypothetical protein